MASRASGLWGRAPVGSRVVSGSGDGELGMSLGGASFWVGVTATGVG